MDLKIVTIRDIIDKKFLIPSYQRGYRWEKIQVRELLNDLNTFFKSAKGDELYFLQPIVIKKDKNNNVYRVIDGQQRLTTIYLILKFFENYIRDDEEYGFKDEFYEIAYETREKSNDFLKKIKNKSEEKAKENIDFYYIYKAYQTIKSWYNEMRENDNIKRSKFVESLLFDKVRFKNEPKLGRVAFIWYEIDNSENENSVFTRLNLGKIPLTDSELIKTIFLKYLDEKDRLKLTSDWDDILYTLNNDNFFSFLTNKKYDDRMEFLLELLIDNFLENRAQRYLFFEYEKMVKNKDDVDKYWSKTKRYFRSLKEFFENNKYYHYIGYLTNSNKANIKEICKEYFKQPKSEFIKFLEEKSVIDIKKEFDELNYNEDKKEIEKILFLFNVLIAKDTNGYRYPFDLHNKEKWSLEHINAKNSENIKKEEDKRKILESQRDYLSDDNIKKRIEKLLKKEKIDDKEFEKIQNKIFKDSDDTISNLALLGLKNNIILSNSIFPAKRDKLIELEEKEKKFIPIATKYVFLKYFSKSRDFYSWDKKDREAYLKKLKEILIKNKPFIQIKKG